MQHHMEKQDLLHPTLPGYKQDPVFAVKIYRREAYVFLFVQTCISAKLVISHNCKEKDLEICATELETKSSKLTTLSLYRVPPDLNKFIKNLDDALKHQYKPTAEFLICGDVNTDYFAESN